MKKLLALITAICVFMVVSKPVFAVEVKTSSGSIGDIGIEGTNAYSTSISITRNYKEVLGAQGHHYVKVYLANEISLTEKVGTINMRTC